MAKTVKMDEIIKPVKELISSEDVLDPKPSALYVDCNKLTTDQYINKDEPMFNSVVVDADEIENNKIKNKIKEINSLSDRPNLDITVDFMNSISYKERFIAEYMQVKIRYEKLCDMLINMEAGTLNFIPTCDATILEDQKYYMAEYIRILRVRAEIENIPLPRI